MTMNRTLGATLLAACLLSASASAHHSGAAIDMTRTLTIAGTVKEFLWANPHCWLYVLAPNDQGNVDEWALEGQAVMGMARTGLRSKTLKPGDKVEVTLAPRKDGKQGGSMKSVKLMDTGQMFQLSSAAPPPT